MWEMLQGKRQRWLMVASIIIAISAVGVAVWPVHKDQKFQSLVDLGYSEYQGTVLESRVTQYLGMRYAAPPVGNLRFRKPAKPFKSEEIQDATAFRPICLGTDSKFPSSSQAEDCLFINVWEPTLATPESKLPVWVYMQGGGYAYNSNANYNGSTVVATSDHQIVFVNFNYRVSSWGFLASEKVRSDGDLNVGLLDQRLALEWVQEHIHQFGGDPEKVVVHGVSAGAGSLALHLTANGGRDDGLIRGAILESPFFPTQPKVMDLEWQFDRYVNATGCAGYTDQLACLRSKNTATLQAANVASPYPGRTVVPRFYWTPTTDGYFIRDYPYKMFQEGKFVKVPLMIGDDTNEGTGFAADAATQEEVGSFLQDNFPLLTSSDTAAINGQYPLMEALPQHEAYFPSAAAAYGDAVFSCSSLHLALSFLARDSPSSVWNYRYNVLQDDNIAAGIGVPHTFETAAIFGVGNTGSFNAKSSYLSYNKNIVPIVMNYWISFVRSLDPTSHRHESAPKWENFGEGNRRRILLETNTTRMEDVPEGQVKNCEFWKGLSSILEH
ncbi:triacylglycerol lipase-like protein [Rhexocercosporidium sp. MPI-PUGE-AT-0058]|nr:triacylglycerol lipase-like protein [Rhexocercosporidium sp. MPI-PUGE-AT-0058]